MWITRGSRLLKLFSRLAVAAFCVFPHLAHGQERALTLDQAIRLTLAGPKNLAGKETIQQARTEALTASLAPNPTVAVEAAMLPLSRRYTAEAPGGPTELAVGIAFPVDWLVFGKRTASMAAADVAVTLAEAQYADLIRRQATETTLAFYRVLEAEALHELSQATIGDLERAEGSVAKAVEHGGRTRIELSRLRLELQSARRELRLAELEVVSAKAALRSSVGAASLQGDLRVEGPLDSPLTAHPLPADIAVRIATENRPDLWALRHKVTKAERDQTMEGRRAFPEVSLGLGIAHQFQRPIGAPDVTAWGASAEVSLPVFDRNQGNRAKAASSTQQSRYELDAAMIEIRAELEQTGHALSTARLNAAETAHTELELATHVREGTRDAYLVGGRTFLELLDAQRAYRDTYRAYITSRAEYLRALVRYESALGRRLPQ
jgi:outer membrane protein, heavy metal efflux system